MRTNTTTRPTPKCLMRTGRGTKGVFGVYAWEADRLTGSRVDDTPIDIQSVVVLA